MLDDSIRRIVLLLFFWLLGISTVWNSAAFAIQSDDKGGSEENPAWANTSQQDPFLIKENISGKLMPRYGFRIPSMALLLHSDGRLSAHLLFSGVQIWSVDTGGSVLNAKIEEHPTPDASHDDPLALPFWVKGDMLFTRKCFQCTATDSSASSLASSSSSSNTADADAFSEDAGFPPWHSPSPAHPNFFINLSALITRGHMLVGTTDIYVTTKARIMDVSSYDGKPIESTYSLLPHLHIVRYDVTVCAHRPGKYKWQLNVAQYRLTEASLSRASGNVLEEEHPSFISRVLQGLLHEEGTDKDLQRLDDAMQDLELQPFNEEYPIEKQLRIREVDLCNYMLWNSHDNAPLWSEPILAEDVTGAYAWITERSIIYRLPVYRLTPPKTVGTALVTSIDTDVEARFWQLTTWDVDIAADEREARELQSSYDMCHWAYSTALLPLIPNYTEGGEQSLVAFQFLPTVSQLWTLTAARRTVFFTFHVLCFLISLGFICLGVIPRRRLRNAWAQLDSLMDDLRQSSRPNSTKLLPSDHALKDGDSARIVEETNNVLATTDSENDLNSSPDCLSLDYQATYMRDPEKGSGDPLHREDGGDDFWWRTGGRVEDEAGSLVDNSSLNELRSGNTVTRSPRANSNAVSPHLFQQHFVVIEKIGWGAEGCVFCVEHRFTRVKYAIKAIHIKYEEQERCVGEALLHSALDFSNVVRFFYCWFEDFTRPEAESLNLLRNEDSLELRSVYTDDSSPTISRTESILSLNADAIYRILFIQMEYFPRGTLADYFRKRDRFTRLENLEHILQIANGLRYIHEQLVVHRDLKPTNIFLSESGVVKIGDFGLAKKRSMHGPSPRVGADELGPNFVLCEEERSIAGGSPLYCSPEQLEGKPATPESDIYSLGVIAVESYCLFNTLHERFRTLEEARRGVIAEAVMGSYPDEMKLFQAMLLERKEGRPSVNYIIQKLNHFIKAEKSGREKMSNTVKAKAVLHNGSEIESESMGSTQEVLKENSRKAFEERQLDSFGSPIQ